MSRHGPSRREVLAGIVGSLFTCFSTDEVHAVPRPVVHLDDTANSIPKGLILVTTYTYDGQGNRVSVEERRFVEGPPIYT